MERNSTIADILKAAGKSSDFQSIRIVDRIDGIDCFEPEYDPSIITIVKEYNLDELKKEMQTEPNALYREDMRSHIEELTRIKDEWLKTHKRR